MLLAVRVRAIYRKSFKLKESAEAIPVYYRCSQAGACVYHAGERVAIKQAA